MVPPDEAANERVDEIEERLDAMRRRISVLEAEVQENRELNRRLAELTDVVTELLVPLSQRDGATVDELLEQYRTSL
ncbi:MAG: DUF6752 domain-containing protein [Nocardioidaceae bacterium]